METSNAFGRRIRLLRQQKGWTIEDLSFESEINRNYLGDLERGKRNPTLKMIEKLAKVFHMSISDLLKGI